MILNFLENIYSKSWFLPLLIGTIVVLVLLFIIVLITALKDSSKEKKVSEITKENDLADEKADDAFAQVEGQPIEININPDSQILEEDFKNDKEEEINKYENRADEMTDDFTTSDNELAFVSDQGIMKQTEVVDENQSQEVIAAENDLDKIASTLLEEYKKETPAAKEFDFDEMKFDNDENVEEDKSNEVTLENHDESKNTAEQFSSVYVTPDTLEEKSDNFNLDDIPAPQPVRVVNTSRVIDSSKKDVNLEDTKVDINSLNTEEYNLKR